MEEGDSPTTSDSIPAQLARIVSSLFGLHGDIERIGSNLSDARGVKMEVHSIGRGTIAVLIGGSMLCCVLAGIAIARSDAARDKAIEFEAVARDREQAELVRHERAEADLLSRFQNTERESRMAEYYILELDGKLMAGGFIPPSRGYGQWKKEHQK